VLPDNPGRGVTFADFVACPRERDLKSIEKCLSLTSPHFEVRQILLRCWWHFYLFHLKRAESHKRRKVARRILTHMATLEPDDLFKDESPLLLSARNEISKLSATAGGRPPRYQFYRLVLALSEWVYFPCMRHSGVKVAEKHFYEFIRLNIETLSELERRLQEVAPCDLRVKPIKFQMPCKERQILKDLRSAAALSRQIDARLALATLP
jgi:hypothetical protein